MKRSVFRLGSRQRAGAAFLLVVAAIGVVLAVLPLRRASAWWDGTWTYRRKITLNNAASAVNLTNFPIRVSLTSSNIDYSHTQNAGQDIRFVDVDDTTALSYEIEKWDESGTSEVWVKVPQIDASSTTDYIWMYYGKPSASDGQTANSVWDNNYVFVQHLKETAACNVTFTDSTANGHDGTCSNGGPAANSSGKIGSARTFDGTDDFIEIPNSTVFNVGTGSQTIDLWVNPGSTSTYHALLSRFSSGGWEFYLFASFFGCGGTGRICYYDSGSDQGVASGLSASTWSHVAVVKSGTTATFYVNGSSVGSITVQASIANDTRELRIGRNSNGDGPFSGPLDEVRYSTAARSADWIEATYISGNNAMNSFGPEEIYPPEPPVLTALTIDESLQPTFQLRSADPSDPSYLRYKIEVCSTSDCSSILRTIDQTSSQTGWSGQDAQTGTAYVAAATVGSSTLASHSYQAPALSPGTQYWWRAYAIDPGGSNTWSDTSTISSFTTTGPPVAPTLLEPISSAIAPQNPLMLRLATTDPNGSYVQYKIEICSTSNCSVIVRTIDQTSSQTGWTSRDTSSDTAYSTDPSTVGSSQIAVHVYQAPILTASTQYWWRAYAIDPAGYNQWSPASSIGAFTTGISKVNIQGGTTIKGGTKIGQ